MVMYKIDKREEGGRVQKSFSRTDPTAYNIKGVHHRPGCKHMVVNKF